MGALSSGGLHKTGKDAVGFQSAFRSSSEAYLAEDHQMSERLFRVIVRGWYAGAAEESKEKFLIGSCEIGPEGLGGFETKRMFADVAQLHDEAFFDLGRCFQANYWLLGSYWGHPLKGTCQEKIVLRQKTEFFTG
jgi:hypothetical protein